MMPFVPGGRAISTVEVKAPLWVAESFGKGWGTREPVSRKKKDLTENPPKAVNENNGRKIKIAALLKNLFILFR